MVSGDRAGAGGREDALGESSGPSRHGSAGSEDQKRAGIFDGFEAYWTVTDDDYRSLFTSGMIVLDTNVLLDLYRYHPETRKELLDVLRRLRERLWVPNHVMAEFWENRESVLKYSRGVTAGAVSDLNRISGDYTSRIRQWGKLIGLRRQGQQAVDELCRVTESALAATTAKIRDLGTDEALKTAEDTRKDAILRQLKSILQDHVGSPLDADRKQNAIKEEAPLRFAENRPPGYMDKNKDSNQAGDYLIWIEILEEAAQLRLDVLFITNDAKEDWWRLERRQTKGPNPQLVEEMRNFAGVRLFMLRPESFFKLAGDLLHIKVSRESVEEAQRVSSTPDIRQWPPRAEKFVSAFQIAGRLINVTNSLDKASPGTRTSAVLSEPIARLRDIMVNTTEPQVVLDAIWAVIGEADKLRSSSAKDSWQPTQLEREVWSKVDLLHIEAVRVWLEEVAEQSQLHPGEIGLDDIPLPPTVVQVNVGPETWAGGWGIGWEEITALLRNGEEVRIKQRI